MKKLLFTYLTKRRIICLLLAALCISSSICTEVWAGSSYHKELDAIQAEYIQYYYEKNGYTVTDMCINEYAGTGYSEQVQVTVKTPYGEVEFLHKVEKNHFSENNWDQDEWKPWKIISFLDSDAFTGEWSYNGKNSHLKLTIHKIDFQDNKVAFEYDFDYCDGASRNNSKCVGKSDRVLVEYLQKNNRGYNFSIEDIGETIYITGTEGVMVNSKTVLSKDDNYQLLTPFLPAASELFRMPTIDCTDGSMTNKNSTLSYQVKNFYPDGTGMANYDGDGTRKSQTFLLYGGYRSLCGVAYIGEAENENQNINKSAEIRIYGDGELIKTISSDEVKDSGYEMYFEADVTGVQELTIDMPGEIIYYDRNSWGSVPVAFLNLGNLIVSKNDTYEALRFCDNEEGALQYQSVWEKMECILASYQFYDNAGWRPIIITVPYDSQYYVLNDDFEYKINEETARQYAKTVYDEIAEPGSDSILIVYFSDGIEKKNDVVDRYFYFYCPTDKDIEEKIQKWFLNACKEEKNRLPYRITDTLIRNDAILAVKDSY